MAPPPLTSQPAEKRNEAVGISKSAAIRPQGNCHRVSPN
jgi:hypothetical protein